MARWRFPNEDEQNNNEHTSSMMANDNKYKNAFFATKSDNGVLSKTAAVPKKCGVNGFQVRSQLSSYHISNNTSYKATKVLISDSTVSRLASKFNGFGVHENRTSTTTTTTTTTTSKIRTGKATTRQQPTKKPTAIRDSSVCQTIKFFENDSKCKLASATKGEQPLDRKGRNDADVQSQPKSPNRLESKTDCHDNLLVAGRERRTTPDGEQRLEKGAKSTLQPKAISLLKNKFVESDSKCKLASVTKGEQPASDHKGTEDVSIGERNDADVRSQPKSQDRLESKTKSHDNLPIANRERQTTLDGEERLEKSAKQSKAICLLKNKFVENDSKCKLASDTKGEQPLGHTEDVSNGERNDADLQSQPKSLDRLQSKTKCHNNLPAAHRKCQSTPDSEERSEKSVKPGLQPKAISLLKNKFVESDSKGKLVSATKQPLDRSGNEDVSEGERNDADVQSQSKSLDCLESKTECHGNLPIANRERTSSPDGEERSEKSVNPALQPKAVYSLKKKFLESDSKCKLASDTTNEQPSDRKGTEDVSKGERDDDDVQSQPKSLDRLQSKTECHDHLPIANRERLSTPDAEERSEKSGVKPALNRCPAEVVGARSYENSHYHAPKLLTRTDKATSADFQIVTLNKSKRLSLAKDFSLESVLNGDDRSDGDPSPSDVRENVVVAVTRPRSNESFLHKYLEQCLEVRGTSSAAVEKGETKTPVAQRPPDEASDVRPTKNASSSSRSDSKSRNSSDVYEELPWPEERRESDEESAVHYSYINEGHSASNRSSNVYDDIIYAKLFTREDTEEYESISPKSYSDPVDALALTREDTEEYESISPKSYCDPADALKNEFSVPSAETVASHSDSDSSFEQANSLYEQKRTFAVSSATTSTFSSSTDCINIKIESPYVSNTKSSNSDIADYEDEFTDEEDDNHEEIIHDRKRPIMNHLRKFRKPKIKFFHRSSIALTGKSENTYTDEVYDDFDDSASESDPSELKNGHVEAVYQLNREQTTNVNRSQNIYGFVGKAVRKSLNSLTQIRRIGNSSNNLPLRPEGISSSSSKSVSVEEVSPKNSHSIPSGGTVRWPSFKSKFRPRYSSITTSTSVFYISPEDLCFDKRGTITKKQSNVNTRRRKTTCIELRPARPTSPPPPPPVDKTKFSENHSVSYSNIYSNRSISSCESKSSVIGTDSTFDLNSSSSSDLNLRFADEPLYQFYAESIVKLTTNDSLNCITDSEGYEEIASNTSRPSAMELIIPSPNGHGQHRSLWCEVEEVRNSGILDTLSPCKQRLQEAIFEIITSEASYYKSLSVLDKVFACDPLLNDETVLSKSDWKILFGNVAEVRKCSEKLLAALETCWQEDIQLTGLCDVIYKHASEHFKIFVKYCSNQIYIDRTLKTLKEQNARFVEIISQLEANPSCQSLSLHSFLMLPMQRITRMPLLLHAVLSRMDPINDSDDFKKYQITLATVNKVVKECNETARDIERHEEMLLISRQLKFSRKDVKTFPVASTKRWLIRSGPMVHINLQDYKLTFTRKLTKQTTKFYFFLFNDILVISKKKSDDSYVVFDYCAKNMLQMSQMEDNCTNTYRYLLLLTILENHEEKSVEMILSCDSDSTRQRWLEATSCHLTSDNPEEKLYEQWDCPQVSALHAYTAVQPDELSLQAGDVVKVMKKTTDGWYHGERIRDGTTGWFPGNYTVEIASQHARAKNLKLRHRLLTLSGNYLLQCQQQQQKKL